MTSLAAWAWPPPTADTWSGGTCRRQPRTDGSPWCATKGLSVSSDLWLLRLLGLGWSLRSLVAHGAPPARGVERGGDPRRVMPTCLLGDLQRAPACWTLDGRWPGEPRIGSSRRSSVRSLLGSAPPRLPGGRG